MLSAPKAKMSHAEIIKKYISATDPIFNQEAWDAMKEEITLELLLERPTEGPFKGINILSMLAGLVESAVFKPFLEIFEKFKDEIPYAEFLHQTNKESPNILARLASSPGNDGCLKPFLEVYFNYEVELKVEHFLEKTLKSPSVLWQLAYRASINDFDNDTGFLAVWNKFHDAIPLAILTEESGEEEVSIIWQLALAYYCNDSESLVKVWQKFEKEMPLAALTAIPRNPQNPYQDISALWHITQVADANQKTDLLFSIWERFKKEMSVQDWLVCSKSWPETIRGNEPSPYCGRTALSILATSDDPKLKKQATEILAQIPGLVPYTQCYELALLSQGTAKLLAARSEFYFALEEIKKNRTPKTEKAVYKKAKKAEEAGYFNAYFELAHYFSSQKDSIEQLRAFRAVSANSWHFEKVQADLVLSFINSLNNTGVMLQRRDSILSIIKYALHAAPQMREVLLQKIAACYIFGEGADTVEKPLPKDLVEVMVKQSAAWCLKRIEEIREMMRLKAENVQLKDKSSEQPADVNMLVVGVARPVLKFSAQDVAPTEEKKSQEEEKAKRPRHK